jgi:hypothetical protein
MTDATMTITRRLLAFACGIAAVAATNAFVVDFNLRAQGDGPVEVCVDDKGVMRLVTAAASCSAGERRVALKAPQIEKSCGKERQSQVAGMKNRLAALERNNTLKSDRQTETAPFEVVNERGTVVFSVQESAGGDLPALTRFFDDTGARIATIAAREAGGELTVSSAGAGAMTGPSGIEATLAAWAEYADFTVTANSNRRLELGRRRETKNYALATFTAGGKLAAGIAESVAGSGIVLIFDELGRQRISLHCACDGGAKGGGVVNVINSAGLPVASLSGTGAAESGLLLLTNNSGEPMVKAEFFPGKNVGAVQAGPGAFQHGLMFLPLPASYIEGK